MSSLCENEGSHLDLFSGIGGFALAARWAGYHTIGFSEIDKYASRVLQARFPRVRNFGDIRNLRGEQFRGCSLLTGGFPCQPYSLATAGKRRGEEDDRALWPEMVRVISEARPRWLLGENVLGFASMGLDEALDDLESIQYSTEALIVPACAVGAPHKRDRIWIIGRDTFAHSSSERLEGSEREEPQGRIDGFAHGGWLATNAHGAGCEKQRRSKSASEGYEAPQCPRWWTIEPELDRVVDGVPNRVDKLTGLGNAIVPHVAYEFMRFMKEIDRNGI